LGMNPRSRIRRELVVSGRVLSASVMPHSITSFVKALRRPHPLALPESFAASPATVRAEPSRHPHRRRSKTRWVPNPRIRMRRTDWFDSWRPFCSRRWADQPGPCTCPRSHALATTTSQVSSLTLGPSFGCWSRSLRSCGNGKADLAADVLSARHSVPQTRDNTILLLREVQSDHMKAGPARPGPKAARQSVRERLSIAAGPGCPRPTAPVVSPLLSARREFRDVASMALLDYGLLHLGAPGITAGQDPSVLIELGESESELHVGAVSSLTDYGVVPISGQEIMERVLSRLSSGTLGAL
jgi:hypothetical protein